VLISFGVHENKPKTHTQLFKLKLLKNSMIINDEMKDFSVTPRNSIYLSLGWSFFELSTEQSTNILRLIDRCSAYMITVDSSHR
jgi:hypothetical protein